MFKYLMIMLLTACTSALHPQVSGNVEYERSKSNYSDYSASTGSSHENIYLSDTTILITASVLMNMKADEFVAVWAVKEESKTISDCITKLDKRIASFIQAMKTLGVTEKDIDVDFISEHPIYDYTVRDKYAEETLEGFEVQKNISVRFSERKLFDQLVILASQNEMYDLVKVDYHVKSNLEIRDQLFEESVKIINKKKDKYTQKLNVRLKSNSQIYAENYGIYFPSDRYNSYLAFEAANLKLSTSYSSKTETWIKEKRKSKTYYYQPLTVEGYDFVVNPLIIEPAVQYTLTLKVKYEMIR